jgi:hypothetical protein
MARLRALPGILLLSLLIAVPALAQRVASTIRGTVTDTSGAVIVGGKVTVKNEATGLTRTSETNASGVYAFADLPIGTYSIDIEYPGFKSSATRGILLNVADVREIDIKLETGAITESVSVEVPAVSVKTVGGDVSSIITGAQVRELPLNGRNFLQLALLMPGVTAPDQLNVKDKGLLGGSDVSVSGSATTSNLWTVDGANNNDVGSNRTILIYPSLEAIEEFKIQRASYSAEFGQAAGGQINIVTRGGTNEFHGSVFYFGRNDALNSKNYFLEQANRPKDELSRHDFGWNLGGPIIKDKLHFFASQEWNREQRGTVRTAFVPTAEERVGNFSGPGIAGCTLPVPNDPNTGAPFAGSVIPANRLSAAGLSYLKLYPLPNTVPVAGSCNNWVDSLTTPLNWRQENIRVDWTLSNTTRLMARYTQDSWTNKAPNLQSNLWGDDPFPSVDSDWDQPAKSLMVQLTHNVGSKGVNTISFSYSANKILIDRSEGTPGLNAEILNNMPSIYPLSQKQYGNETGHPVWWGGGGYTALWNEAPFRNNQDLFVLKDDYSAVFGKHLFKAGFLASTNTKNEDSNGNGSAQNSAFWGSAGLNGWGANTGNVLADWLLKDMTWGFSEPFGFRQTSTKWKDLEFYVHDSWKVSPKLTVDIGARWSMLYNYYSDDDTMTSFVPALFNPALGGDPCNGLAIVPGSNPCASAGFRGGTDGPNRSLQEQKYDAIAPRLGFAYDISGTGKTSIRGGLGLFYLRERLSGGLSFPNNPPFGKITSGLRKLDSNTEPCGGCFGVSSGRPTSGRDPNAVVPNSWQWNIGVEHEIVNNTKIELMYVGSKSSDQLHFYDANYVAPANRLAYGHTGGGTGTPADYRAYPQFGADGTIVIWGHDGEAKYHSLQAQLVSRFGRGSQFQASYTWSKSTGNLGLADSGGLDPDNSVTDITNPDLDWGPTRINRPHIFNASLILMLPTFEDKGGFMKHVLGDWELATIAAYSSGQSMTVYTTGIPGIQGGPSGTGYANNQRPNVTGESCNADGGLPEQILNPAAFSLNGFKLGTIGNAGRGICTGPDYAQVDLSLYKNIRINDRFKMQLRFEVFNVFNRANFLSNQLNNTFNPAAVTFDTGNASTATTITGFSGIPGNFGQSTGTRDPRQAQFGIKLMF